MLVSAPVRMKLEKSDSPAPSCVSLKSMDEPGNFKGEFAPNPKNLKFDFRMKLENSKSPAPSCVSLKSMDEPLSFNQEHTPPDSSVKMEKSDSPAPSCVSLRSMDPPGNFTGEFTPNPNVKMEKSDSPAPSCVSLRSMDHPRNFTGEFAPNPKVKLEKADSPAPSCVSLKSMDKPLNFKQEHTPADSRLMKLERFHSPGLHSVDSEDMKRESITPAHASELAVSLLTNEDFRCSVCTGVLKDPVSIPCGHSYCKQCITSYWEQPSQAGHYACPQCPRTYSSHPALYSNSALALVVHKLEHFSPVLPAQIYAGPGDVECDFCTGLKLKAVKTCLTCTASFCGTHVKEHYTIPALQRHTLVEAVETMEEKMIHTELKQENRQLKRQVSHLQDTISTSDCKVRKEEKNIREQQQELTQQLLEALQQQQELAQQLQEAQEQKQELAQQLQETQEQKQEQQQELAQQLQEAREQQRELAQQLLEARERVWQQQQHEWRPLGVRSDQYMWQRLQEAKQQEGKEKLTQPVSDGQALIAEPVTREDFLKYSCHFTLDPNTADSNLHLSEGNRRVEWRPEAQPYPDHPDRFDSYYQVLCREGVSARCYWEVERSGYVGIAVAYKSISRKGGGDECVFGFNDQSWRLDLYSSSSSYWHNSKETYLPLVASSRIGVYVDHRAGTLAFYSISGDTVTLLHRVHTTFTHTLYPGFWVYGNGSSVKLL